MGLVFRIVNASPEDPVESWPFEGVLAALERGGLEHWRRLDVAIDADPWGQVARYVEQAVAVAHLYGVSELMMELIARARATERT